MNIADAPSWSKPDWSRFFAYQLGEVLNGHEQLPGILSEIPERYYDTVIAGFRQMLEIMSKDVNHPPEKLQQIESLRSYLNKLFHHIPFETREDKGPDICIVWDPAVFSPEDYAELVQAIGDVVRAHGGLGLQFISGEGKGVTVDEGVLA